MICAPYCIQKPDSREIYEEKLTGFAYSNLGVGFQWLSGSCVIES